MDPFNTVLKVAPNNKPILSSVVTQYREIPSTIETIQQIQPTNYAPTWDMSQHISTSYNEYIIPTTANSITEPTVKQSLTGTISTTGSILPNTTWGNKDIPYFVPYGYINTFNNNLSTVASSIIGQIRPELITSTIIADEVVVNQYISLDNAVLTAVGETLFLNGQVVATAANISSIAEWAYFPMISTLDGDNQNIKNVNKFIGNELDVSYISTGSVLTSSIKANYAVTNVISTNNILVSSINGSQFISGSNWSFYNAINSNVNLNGANIVSGSNQPINIIAGSTIGITSQYEPVQINSGFNYYSGQQPVTINGGNGTSIVADGGLFGLGVNTNLNINAKGGYKGVLNLIADGGGNAQTGSGIGGLVNIEANGSQGLSNVGSGGTVLITANTPLGASLTSKISLSASCVESYAGYTGAKLSLAGYNYMWGSLGCSIVASLIPPSFAQTPGSCYLYGDSGIVVGNDMYVYRSIRPFSNGISNPIDLTIRGRNDGGTPAYVVLSNVSYMYMDANAQIRDVGLITGQSFGVISGFSNIGSRNFYADLLVSAPTLTGNQVLTSNITCSNNIQTNNINLNTINGQPYNNTFTQISTFSTLTTRAFNVSSINGLSPFISTFNSVSTQSLLVSSINGAKPITNYISSFPSLYASDGFFNNIINSNAINTASLFATTVNTQIENVSSLRVSTINGATPITYYISSFNNIATNEIDALGANLQIQNNNIGGTLNIYSLGDQNIVSGAGQQLFLASKYTFGGGTVNANTTSTTTAFISTATIYKIIQPTNEINIKGVRQPFIQYGSFTATGTSGNFTVTLPVPYANTTYVSMASMNDTNPAQMSCVNLSVSAIRVYWASAGGGTQTICWTTYGNLS